MASIKQRLQPLLREAAAGQGCPPFCCSAALQRTTAELEVAGLGRLKAPLEESLLEQLQGLGEPLGAHCWRLNGSKVVILNKREPGAREARASSSRALSPPSGSNRAPAAGGRALAAPLSPSPASCCRRHHRSPPPCRPSAGWQDKVDSALGAVQVLLDLRRAGLAVQGPPSLLLHEAGHASQVSRFRGVMQCLACWPQLRS